MTPENMGKKIIEMSEAIALLDQKVSALCVLIATAATEEGYPRCAVRAEKIRRIEQLQAMMIKGGLGTFILVIIAELTRFFLV